MKFKDFLNESDDMATALTRTLGRKLTQSGWSNGPRGSGIVAMTDDKSLVKSAVKTIEDWLKSIGADNTKMVPGKITGDMSVSYKEGSIAVVETAVGLKVLFS